MEPNERKDTHLHILHGDYQGSILLVDGLYSSQQLESCIKSILHITDSKTEIVGVKQLVQQSEDKTVEGDILIPLPLICSASSTIDESKWYIPQLYAPAPAVTETPLPIPAINDASNAPTPSANNDTPPPNQSNWGYYGDPWQNDEYFGQYGKLVCFY